MTTLTGQRFIPSALTMFRLDRGIQRESRAAPEESDGHGWLIGDARALPIL
jgi:hypothetical protein